MSSTPPTQRADAQRNRARILDAAAAALAADPAASLNAIARAAGVGAGTLYRHFPAREDLVLALYGHEVERLAGTVGDLLAERTPPDALRTWFLQLAELVHLTPGLGDALDTAAARAAIDATYAPVLGAIRAMLDAGEATRDFRPGLDPSDVLLLMSSIWRAAGPAQAQRLADTVVAALRPS